MVHCGEGGISRRRLCQQQSHRGRSEGSRWEIRQSDDHDDLFRDDDWSEFPRCSRRTFSVTAWWWSWQPAVTWEVTEDEMLFLWWLWPFCQGLPYTTRHPRWDEVLLLCWIWPSRQGLPYTARHTGWLSSRLQWKVPGQAPKKFPGGNGPRELGVNERTDPGEDPGDRQSV